MRTIPILTALIALSPLAIPARADTNKVTLPIEQVSLYTSGVGYFERHGSVDGDASETLLFPVDQVNDILKSLVLLDLGGGQISPVTYGAKDPLSKELQAYSVDLSDNPDRATLLNRLRGASVKITLNVPGSTPISGTILGVETKTIDLPNNSGTTSQTIVNLMTDSGLESVNLDSIETLQFLDPVVNSEITAALAQIANGRDDSKRPITINFSGSGKRDVTIGYVTATPLWQTSYRLVLGDKPIIQGWAHVENTSQDDWTNIHLTLTSGRPVSFIQDLYSPIYINRQTIQSQIAQAPGAQLYRDDLLAAKSQMDEAPVALAPNNAPVEQSINGAFGGGGGLRGFANTASMKDGRDLPYKAPDIEYALSQSIASSGATLGQSLFSYIIDEPVSIPRSQSAMIPFLASGVTATRVSIYNQSVLAEHPMNGARMVNTTKLHLMGGPVTVFDQQNGGTGYVGDAEISDTDPGQSRLFSFAVDLNVDADSKPGDSQGVSRSVVITKGTLIARQVTRTSTDYTFKNNSSSKRTIVVEHPITVGYKLITPEKPDEKTSDVYRFDVPVNPGESKKFTVTQEHEDYNDYGLSSTDDGTFTYYIQNGQLSPAVKDALTKALSMRHQIATTQAAISNIQAQITAISAGQDRIRKNMNALDKSSALYKRYVGELDIQETDLGQLNDRLSNLNDQLTSEQNALSDYLSNLTVE